MTAMFPAAEFRPKGVQDGFDLGLPSGQAQTFEWLANIFLAPPSAAEIAAYRHGPAAVWLEQLRTADVLAEGILQMRGALSGDIADAALAAHLGKMHVTLFSGLAGPATVSPYESAYEGDGRLFQSAATDMADLLRAHDMHVSRTWAEAPDHLAVELSLLARLLVSGHRDANGLITRLRRWLPAFTDGCAAQDPSGFWSGAAKALTALLAACDPEQLHVQRILHSEDRRKP